MIKNGSLKIASERGGAAVKVRLKVRAMHQCILNVPLWNDWSYVTYSQVHGSPVLELQYIKL